MLNHQLTPCYLLPLNKKLESLLHCEELESINFALFNELITERHHCVVTHLAQLEVEERKAFAALEIDSTQELTNCATQLRDEHKHKLSSLKRSERAIQKFK